MGQLSFFSAEAMPPALGDLEGLLAGPGHVTLTDDGARLSVLVTDAWRSLALLAALEGLGLTGEVTTTSDDELVVRTPVLADLRPIAERWTSGAVKRPPAGFALDGAKLRWWCLAAGTADDKGVVLRLGPHDEEAWPAVGAALAGAGIPSVFLPDGGGGPAYKVVGAKRLRRLSELVGAPPPDAPDGCWPRG